MCHFETPRERVAAQSLFYYVGSPKLPAASCALMNSSTMCGLDMCLESWSHSARSMKVYFQAWSSVFPSAMYNSWIFFFMRICLLINGMCSCSTFAFMISIFSATLESSKWSFWRAISLSIFFSFSSLYSALFCFQYLTSISSCQTLAFGNCIISSSNLVKRFKANAVWSIMIVCVYFELNRNCTTKY